MLLSHSLPRYRLTPSGVLLVGFLLVLLLAGGASRGDMPGQIVVRTAAWFALAMAALLSDYRPSLVRPSAIAALLIASVTLALVQLVPLSPDISQMLPGRAALDAAASFSGETVVWRPWSLVPGATINAASALIVPVTMWVLLKGLSESEHRWLPTMVLGLIALSMFAGLLQFSGLVFNNVFVNDTPGEVAGTFANRNHFAVFLAIGCVLAPVWGLTFDSKTAWPVVMGWGLVLLFLLAILASGSRAGLGLGVVALLLGLVMSARALKKALTGYPKWAFPVLITGILAVIVILVMLSFLADRAVSIDRMFALDQGQDMRGRGLPVVLAMIARYFPAGTGFGGFSQMFRQHEPLDLLKPTVFNHAHNDFLEIALDAGLPGLLLLAAAIIWWGKESSRVWRQGPSRRQAIPQLGSALLLLIILASVVDYPARTPVIMAILVIAANWLNGHSQQHGRSALPDSA